MSSSGMARACSRIRRNKLLFEKDAFSEQELAKRPEVRIINRYAVIRTYMLKALKLVVYLALLWSTVVLLGGFVSSLKRKDFWYLTFIGFMQAAGWIISLQQRMLGALFHKRFLYAIGCMIFSPVVLLAGYSPVICFGLSLSRLRHQDYGGDDGDASKANLKPALNLFYSLTVAQGAIFMSVLIFQNAFGAYLPVFIRRHGFRRKVVFGYNAETVLRYMNGEASTKSWNLITYGAELLDSESHDGFVSGVHALNMLIEQGTQIRWFLIRSPRHRIQKLVSALGWRSLEDRETRGLAARIVAHLAFDLNISEFPGSLETISSLVETSVHQWSDQEVLIIPSKGIRRKRREGLLFKLIRKYNTWKNGNVPDTRKQDKKAKLDSEKGTNEDLLLQGLRILENLSHDKNNCTGIYNNSDLLSLVTAPLFNDGQFSEEMLINDAWIEVVDVSLRVVVQLMKAPGNTGANMRHKISSNSKAIENLQAVLGLEANSGILELQTSAIEVLAQLFTNDGDESTCMCKETKVNFIEKALYIFLTDQWMEDYFRDRRKKIDEEITNQLVKEDEFPTFWEELCPCLVKRKNKKRRKVLEKEKMKKAQQAAREHKELAGEALAMLSMGMGGQSNTDIIMSFKGCGNVVHCLTKMLDSNINTIECKISSTETVKVEINTGCRISAAWILKNSCAHSMMPDDSTKKTLLEKVLHELLNIKRNTESHSESKSSGNTGTATGNDIENPLSHGSDQRETIGRSLHQPEERVLQAALLSLYVMVRAIWTDSEDFASVVKQLVAPKNFVGRLKDAVEENNCATPACLAILKVTCEIVILFIQYGHFIDEIKREEIIHALSEASGTMSGLESCMLFAGLDKDCHGVPVKPLSHALVEQAQQRLREKEAELDNNNPASGP